MYRCCCCRPAALPASTSTLSGLAGFGESAIRVYSRGWLVGIQRSMHRQTSSTHRTAPHRIVLLENQVGKTTYHA